MKKLDKLAFLVVLVIGIFLFSGGCGPTNITQVQEKPYPAYDVIQKQTQKIYYFYTYYGEGIRSYGWWCEQFICDLDGKILKKKSYWVGNDTAWREFRDKIKQK